MPSFAVRGEIAVMGTRGDLDRRRLLGLAAAAGLAGWPGSAGARGPRTDLSGVWTNAWYTELERPKAFKGLIATPAEAEAYEAPRRRLHGVESSPHDVLGQAETEFPDNGPGLARIRGQIRTSWIVDAQDGKVPWIPAQREKLHVGRDPSENGPGTYDNVEQRDTDERCITAPGGHAPMLNSADGNVMVFVQTPDHLAILAEKNHQVRIVRLGHDDVAPDAAAPAWLQPAVGHWEGATLVAVSANYPPGISRINDDLYLSERARVTERFTRTGPDEILYSFTVEDPVLFTRSWRGEMVLRASPGQVYEYACHEGNYSLTSILAAARAEERERNKPAP